MRKVFLLGLVAAAVAGLAVTAAGSAGQSRYSSTKRSKRVVISTRKIPKLGQVLVNGKGLTLYMFVPDKHRRVTCKGTCAAVWPPIKLSKGAKPLAKGKAKARLLGSDRNPAGGRVITYNKWPLYLYVSDSRPGQATGQGLNLNGGLWYVLSPSGKVIRKKA